MTKKEFRAKIESQKESMCKQHDGRKKILKLTAIISGIFAACGLAGLIAGGITDIEPLMTTCGTIYAVSTGTLFGLYTGGVVLDGAHEDDKRQLDQIARDADDIEK